MEFKAATDILLDRITHEDLASELGVSVASVRQARLNNQALAYRSAPPEWERAVQALAERRIRKLQVLLGALEKMRPKKKTGPS